MLYLFCNYFIAYIPIWTIRKMLYRMLGMKISSGSRINMRCVVLNPWNIEIGRNTIINEYCLLDGRGKLIIGNHCAISMYTIIYTASHYAGGGDDFRYYEKNTIIKDYAWVGARAVILPGSLINTNCVVGANSVVCSTLCEENAIYAGSPAKMIRKKETGRTGDQDIMIYFR